MYELYLFHCCMAGKYTVISFLIMDFILHAFLRISAICGDNLERSFQRQIVETAPWCWYDWKTNKFSPRFSVCSRMSLFHFHNKGKGILPRCKLKCLINFEWIFGFSFSRSHRFKCLFQRVGAPYGFLSPLSSAPGGLDFAFTGG